MAKDEKAPEPAAPAAFPAALILKQPVFHWRKDATGTDVLVELAPGDPAPDSLTPEQIEDFRARGIL